MKGVGNYDKNDNNNNSKRHINFLRKQLRFLVLRCRKLSEQNNLNTMFDAIAADKFNPFISLLPQQLFQIILH